MKSYLYVKEIVMKKAFTLAEVLITIGIIGLIASLILPRLIQNYKNLVVETRLKRFYSAFNQAIQRSEIEYGDKKYWYKDAKGAELDAWMAKYIEPYMIITKKEIKGNARIFYLKDGSAFKTGVNRQATLRDIHFYPSGKVNKCDNSKRAGHTCLFPFLYNPLGNTVANDAADYKYHYDKGLEPYMWKWNGNYNTFEQSCVNGSSPSYCTAWIKYNGWKIPKNYPYKVW